MIHSQPNLEADLAAELRKASGPYRRALAVLQSPSAGTTDATDWNETLSRLQPMMRLIQESEVHLAPLRGAWIESKRRGGPELRQLLAEHRQLLESLLARIDELESRLRKRRGELAPQVDTYLRHQQMQRAYHTR